MRCLCLCKDTNFLANHNTLTASSPKAFDVYASAKILIFQQITTILNHSINLMRCLCLCKDTNFLANHNPSDDVNCTDSDVYASAKILIFQQITTQDWQAFRWSGCLCLCKDTNFLANHNQSKKGIKPDGDVYASAKILIFQQITTRVRIFQHRHQMFMPLQRY